MKPVIFSGCFGWLHEGRSATGIVICAGLGHEDMIAHRGLRVLSERLAARGFHVLRFDYPGTGDSSGTEDDPGRLPAWRDSIIAAVHYLQSVSKTERVILVGLRLGATLALLAAESLHQICGVAGLAPVFSGKTYLRELRLRARAWKEAHLIVDRQSVKSLDVLGQRLGEETIAELLQLDLMTLNLYSKSILILCSNEDLVSSHVLERLQRQNCKLTVGGFPGYMDYLEDSVSSILPQAEFESVINWCDQFIPNPLSFSETHHATKIVPFSRQDNHDRHLQCLVLPEALETAARFGAAQHLFGILCCPADVKCEVGRPVIMLNTGFGRHIGDGRVFTTLARQLAGEGTASLRMNLAGFGDSDVLGNDIADPYAADAFKDVKAAIDYLEYMGYSRPVVIGVCSGAFTAFHAAIEDPRISEIVLVNIQTFLRNQGLSLKVQIRRQRRPLGFYLRAMTQMNAWCRLFHGEFAVSAILLSLCGRPLAAIKLLLSLNFERLSGRQMEIGQVSRWFHQLNARGVQTNLLYSDGDPGLTELALWFGRGGRRLKYVQNVQLNILGNADHALLDHSARLRFIDFVLCLMKRQCHAETVGVINHQ